MEEKEAKTTPARKPKTAGRISLKDAFLAAYTSTASVQKAAEAAGVHKSQHYRWLKDDEEYAGKFAAAQDEAAQTLEDEAVRRASEGVEDAVIYQGQLCYPYIDAVIDEETGVVITPGRRSTIPLTKRTYSDSLLVTLLKRFRPEKYRENIKAELSGANGGPIEIIERLNAGRNRLAALQSTPENES